MILENLGPKGKLFEDLEDGDYLFEISEPGPKGWVTDLVSKDDMGNELPNLRLAQINWSLRVVQPEESENRRFLHSTWLSATPEKMESARRPWNPASFTYQFCTDVGIAMKDGNNAIILDEFLGEDGNFLTFGWDVRKGGSITGFTCDTSNLNKTIGLRFWGSIRKKKQKGSDVERATLTKAWQDK